MNRDEMVTLNEKLDCTGYALNKVKDMSHELTDIVTKIQLLASMTEDNLAEVDLYQNFVWRQKKEIKGLLSEIYGMLELDGVSCRQDYTLKRNDG